MSKYTKKLKLNLIIIFTALNIFVILGLTIYSRIYLSTIEHYTLAEDVIISHKGRKDYKGSIRDYKLYDQHNDDFYTLYMTIPKNTLKKPILFLKM
jgi:hypothetical protein